MNLKKINYNFYENGFVVIRNLINKKKISKILDETVEIKKKIIFKSKQHFHLTKNGKFNTIHDINKYIKKGEIINLSKNKRILRIVKNILRETSKLRNIELFFKPKKTGMPSPYHQDNFYWNINNAKALNVWIACSKSSFKNGAIGYLVGSQKLGTIKHEISFSKGSSQKIPEFVLKNLKFKRFFPKLTIGDCIIHHPEVIHGSDKNLSNNDRIGLVFSYKSKSATINKNKLAEYKKNIKENLNKVYNK